MYAFKLKSKPNNKTKQIIQPTLTEVAIQENYTGYKFSLLSLKDMKL